MQVKTVLTLKWIGMDVPLSFEFGVEWIWIQLSGVDWNRGWKSAPWRPLQDSDVTRGVSDKGTKGLGGQPAGTAGRRQVRCRVTPGTADRDYFGGTVVSDKHSCPLEILPASALSDRSERLSTVSDSQLCEFFFSGKPLNSHSAFAGYHQWNYISVVVSIQSLLCLTRRNVLLVCQSSRWYFCYKYVHLNSHWRCIF